MTNPADVVELVKRLRDHADGPDGTAPDGGEYPLGRDLFKAAALIERQAKELAELQELAYFYPPTEPFAPDGQTYKQLVAERDARIAALEVDAGRYRWLRDQIAVGAFPVPVNFVRRELAHKHDVVDAAIDDAPQEKP